MSSPIVPLERSNEVEGLRAYFQRRKPELEVRAGWHFDMQAASFPFDDGPNLKYLLRVKKDVLRTFSVAQIILMLEKANWEQVLEDLQGDQMAIFTSTGFVFQERPD